MGKRYGSKAAYEEARAGIRAERAEMERLWNMTDEERTKERNRDRLKGDEAMMTHMMFMAAAMAGGEKPNMADKSAASAVGLLKARFT